MIHSDSNIMDRLVSLAKRRGFIFPSSEIYGGIQGFWDFGPLGVEIKNNIKRLWWKHFVQQREDIVGIDTSIIMNRRVWEVSGHASGFADQLVECRSCHVRFKEEDVHGGCPNCKKKNWTSPQDFNTMFRTFVGSVEGLAAETFLRPETAQGIFVNFETIVKTMRMKLPFGIAQIGKAFRNEMTPGNFIFRSREFEQMEIEYFVKPGEDHQRHEAWVNDAYEWLIDCGIKRENLRKREQTKAELAHYAKATVDLEYRFPFEKGWAEVVGISNRTDFDLTIHGQHYQDPESKEKWIPYTIEPSFGVDRLALTLLLDAYEEVEGGRTTTTESTKEVEVVLRLHRAIAPIKVAVLPLTSKNPLKMLAREIHHSFESHWSVQYDEVASIGRRYRRQDEIGTPYCVTVDFQSIEDHTVTVRDRDTMKQKRVGISELEDFFRQSFND